MAKFENEERIFDPADAVIQECISLTDPKSFFLFAGAGSGKTGALVEALKYARGHLGATLARENRYIGVITYTNAAADEIARRSEQFPFFAISTIHSFAWELIEPFQRDIKAWLTHKLESDLAQLATKRGKNKERDLVKKQKRLETVRQVDRFSYSPTKPNTGRDSLNHGNVISICTDFLQKPLMQEIFISRFPVLLIDESQDTSKNLMDAFLSIHQKHSTRFMLGLFGDMMQRIYLDGKESLERAIGDDWAKPEKSINYRSPKRIINLINTIRSAGDKRSQTPGPTAMEGFVRIFIANSSHSAKPTNEESICQLMAAATGDPLWSGENKDVKTLTLEHKMAAERFGFMTLFEALDISKTIKERAFQKLTAQDPSPQLKELAFFTEIIHPLVKCHREQDYFGVATIVKSQSPLLQRHAFVAPTADHEQQMSKVRESSQALLALWENSKDPFLRDIVDVTRQTLLFEAPTNLTKNIETDIVDGESSPASPTLDGEGADIEGLIDPEERQKRLAAWGALKDVPFSQVEKYYSYIKGESYFDTHQGVKGLGFPRVMVVLDDEAAGGHLFSYEKLFGVKALSDTDNKNIAEGKDSALTRTNRLFYVICSRAEQSLAIVVYTTNPRALKEFFLTSQIFKEEEIHIQT